MLRRLALALRRLRFRFFAAAVAGVLYGFGFAGWGYWYLSWLSFLPLLWAIDDPRISRRESACIAWLAGFIAHGAGFSWMVYLLVTFAGLPIPLAILGYLLLNAGQSTIFAGFGWLYHGLRHRWALAAPFAAVAAWLVVESIWPALFPSYLANSQYKNLMWIQSADLWGPTGVGAIMVFIMGCAFVALRDGAVSSRRWLAWGLVATFANLSYGVVALWWYGPPVGADAGNELEVAVLQAGLGAHEKHASAFRGIRTHQLMAREAAVADLIVWPESSYNAWLGPETDNVFRRVHAGVPTPMLFGGLRFEGGEGGEGTRRRYNTAVATDALGNIQGHYDKNKLLAFGEYVPFADQLPRSWTEWIPAGSFTPGANQSPVSIEGVSYGVLICYEDILPSFVRKTMRHRPDVLVNVTNDSWYAEVEDVWYGNSIEPEIHLALSVFRSIEHRRHMVRAVNSGISAFISPTGAIESRTGLWEQTVLRGKVRPLQHRTVFGFMGGWLVWVALVGSVSYRLRFYFPAARAPVSSS